MKENNFDVKAIIFDMDGLMFDTENLWIETAMAVAKRWGYEEITEELIKSCMGRKPEATKNIFKSLLDKVSLEREGKEFNFNEYRKQYLAYTYELIESRGMPVKKGLIELLEYARMKNIKTAIATSSDKPRVQFYLNKANIDEDNFNAIICGNMVQKGKPAPDIFLKACEKLAVNPREAIVLEDSISGIIAAYNATTNPVMVIDCIEPIDEIMDMLFIEPLNSLVEVQKILTCMEKNKEKICNYKGQKIYGNIY